MEKIVIVGLDKEGKKVLEEVLVDPQKGHNAVLMHTAMHEGRKAVSQKVMCDGQFLAETVLMLEDTLSNNAPDKVLGRMKLDRMRKLKAMTEKLDSGEIIDPLEALGMLGEVMAGGPGRGMKPPSFEDFLKSMDADLAEAAKKMCSECDKEDCTNKNDLGCK